MRSRTESEGLPQKLFLETFQKQKKWFWCHCIQDSWTFNEWQKLKKRNYLLMQLYCPQHNLEQCTFKRDFNTAEVTCHVQCCCKTFGGNYLKRQKMRMTYALNLHITFFATTKLRLRNVRGDVTSIVQLNPHRVCHVFMATVIKGCNTWSDISDG